MPILNNGGLGITPASGVTTFLASPSSANLRAALTDETGTGALVFAGGALGAATATTPESFQNNTKVATTAFVHWLADSTQIGTHANPSTTTPQNPSTYGPLRAIWYGVTGTINLPAASDNSGRGVLVYNTGAFTITLEPNGSEVIVRDGTVQTGGVSMTLSSGAGNYVYIISDGVRWVTLWYKGTLTEGT